MASISLTYKPAYSLNHLITSPGGDHTVPPGAESSTFLRKAYADSVFTLKTASDISVRATEFAQSS